jgi:hypothetical protein
MGIAFPRAAPSLTLRGGVSGRRFPTSKCFAQFFIEGVKVGWFPARNQVVKMNDFFIHPIYAGISQVSF